MTDEELFGPRQFTDDDLFPARGGGLSQLIRGGEELLESFPQAGAAIRALGQTSEEANAAFDNVPAANPASDSISFKVRIP